MSSIGGRLQEVRLQKLYNVITLLFSPVQLQLLYQSWNVSIDVKYRLNSETYVQKYITDFDTG